jgi:hypothetical protein
MNADLTDERGLKQESLYSLIRGNPLNPLSSASYSFCG